MDLVKGRVSIPQARYFITLCEIQRVPALTTGPTATRLARITTEVFAGNDAELLCGTIMPDHIHLLITLGARLSLDRLLAKYKALTRKALPAGIAWQRNFFEHRLRPDEAANDFARYIFLNPYRAGLIPRVETWPLWMKKEEPDFDFLHMLEESRFPPRQWLEADLSALGLSGDSIGND